MKKSIAALLAIVWVLVGCSTSEPAPTATSIPPTATVPPATVAGRGRVIFENGGTHEDYRLELICTNCHSLDGSVSFVAGSGTGPSMQGIAERAADRVPGLSAEEYIRQSIMDSGAIVLEGYLDLMPKIIPKFLSEEELDDLIAFLLTQ